MFFVIRAKIRYIPCNAPQIINVQLAPCQSPLIINTINKLKNKERIPVYGKGDNIRDWIYVKDHVNALICVLLNGTKGKQYLIGGNNEMSNIEILNLIISTYENATNQKVDWERFDYVPDRLGHDFRYSINNFDFCAEFPEWKASSFEDSIRKTILSYI
jgi:dTDP-glucose 4,6-dehydratase